jgi:hypothetical protein
MAASEAERQQAADPAASGETLMALAGEPELWPILAANPATYDDLLAYLREHGDADVQAALDARGGQAATEPGALPAYAPLSGRPPRSPGGRRLGTPAIVTIVVVGILVLLGAAAAIAIPVLKGTVFSPTKVAQAFVDHIAKGEFAAATALTQIAITPEIDPTLISASSVQLAAGMTDVVVGQAIAMPGTTRVTVDVQFHVEDSPVTGTVVLEPAESVGLVFNNWRIVETSLLGQLDVMGTGMTSIAVGGVYISFPALEADAIVAISTYPGQFLYDASGSQWFVFTGDSELIDTSQPYASLSLTATPTAAFQDEVDQQVQALLVTCLQDEFGSCRYISDLETGESGRCYSYWSLDPDYVRSAAASLQRVPTVAVDGTYGDGSLSVSSTDAGSATLTWEEREFYPDGAWEGCQASVALDFYGQVTVSGDELVVE